MPCSDDALRAKIAALESRVEALERIVQDLSDIREAQASLAHFDKHGGTSLEDLKRELNITD